jgi:hypothetical protein
MQIIKRRMRSAPINWFHPKPMSMRILLIAEDSRNYLQILIQQNKNKITKILVAVKENIVSIHWKKRNQSFITCKIWINLAINRCILISVWRIEIISNRIPLYKIITRTSLSNLKRTIIKFSYITSRIWTRLSSNKINPWTHNGRRVFILRAALLRWKIDIT